MIHMWRELHSIHRQLDIHIALDLPPPHGIGKFLGRFGAHIVAVIIQPIDQRPNGGILFILQKRRIIERPQKFAAPHKFGAE